MQRLNTLLPVLAAGIALVTDWAIPDSSLHPAANRPYFLLVMAVALALTAVLFLAGFAAPAFQKKYSGKAPFYSRLRQRLSHRPGRLVPHQRADGQRHLQHPQRLL